MKSIDFIKRSIELNGDRYNYQLVEFVNWQTPLKIICRIHGVFEQWPYPHLKGAGCKSCKIKETVQKKAALSFVEKAIKKHGNRYSYSKLNYLSSRDRVVITCLIHGDFMMIASNHLMGKGCRKCTMKLCCVLKNHNSQNYQENFIKKATKLHRGFYEYKKVAYKSTNVLVEIVCPFHGSFFQSPHNHLIGAGCKRCSDKAKGEKKRLKAASQFVERAQVIHGNKYDYSRAEYKSSNKKLEIICLKHGIFSITPNSFLRGTGCSKCGTENMIKKQATGVVKFIEQAKEKHGDQYDYSQVVYRSTHKHVIIICSVHGSFKQTPSGHLQGRGCSHCGRIKCTKSNSDTLNDFLIKAKNTHGNKYDYSQVNYINSTSKLTITCSIHGSFEQTPAHHIYSNQGCPSCANRDMNTEKFILLAKEKHKDKYDYSCSLYKTARGYIEIKCRLHGCFKQRAWNHLNGTGCPLCVDAMNSKGVQRIENWLKDKDLSYIREKSFPDLISTKSKKGLRFDFYIPDLEVLIEFDGMQHFEVKECWGGEKAFVKLKSNDRFKDRWVKNKGYIFIRISYLEEEKIEEILANCLMRKLNWKKKFQPCVEIA